MSIVHAKYRGSSDEELMKRAMTGDRKAFEQLYDRYFDKLVWFARQYLSDQHSAEDIIQEVFIRIIEQPERYDPSKKFSTWVYTIVANRCKNVLRDTRNRQDLLSRQSFSGLSEMHHQYDYRKLRDKMKELFGAMNEREKTLFVLRFEHELPLKEIAEITGSPQGTVKSGIHYLLKKLSNHLNAFRHE